MVTSFPLTLGAREGGPCLIEFEPGRGGGGRAAIKQCKHALSDFTPSDFTASSYRQHVCAFEGASYTSEPHVRYGAAGEAGTKLAPAGMAFP